MQLQAERHFRHIARRRVFRRFRDVVRSSRRRNQVRWISIAVMFVMILLLRKQSPAPLNSFSQFAVTLRLLRLFTRAHLMCKHATSLYFIVWVDMLPCRNG